MLSPYHQKRRNRLVALLQKMGGGVALLPTAEELRRNGDATFPFRPESDFWYLTAFPEPHAVLLLWVGAGGEVETHFFCQERDAEREIWDGYRFGPEQAAQQFGFDHAYPIAAFETEAKKWLARNKQVFIPFRDLARFPLTTWWHEAPRRNTPEPCRLIDLSAILGELRLFKDGGEVTLMQTAADISARAHRQAMRGCRPGMREYELEALLLQQFRQEGADAPAYTSIVGTGANSCVLHYRAGNSEIKAGDLVLIDAGCEYQGYAADITRTFPASGRFSSAQRDLYECVLEAQTQAIAATCPGADFSAPHQAALKVLAQGMLDFGLIKKSEANDVEAVISTKKYERFFMHRVSHWLGLDVHDAGSYWDRTSSDALGRGQPLNLSSTPDYQEKRLAHGMVLTIEPGFYVRPADDIPEAYWNCGIRIEDDVLVSAVGPQVLTANAPKTVTEIESLMCSN